MEYQFQTATGKSMGEVIRDVAEFLSTSCIINPQRRIDLCTLLPELNMREQLAYALLSEARLQGWSTEKSARFCKQSCGAFLGEAKCNALLQAFQSPSTSPWIAYTQKYGNRFTLFDSSYWATALALGIDCNNVELVLGYLRQFIVILTEFAYMEANNPEDTYGWGYYRSFRKMMDDLMKPPSKAPLPVSVCAIGGTAGKCNGASYFLTLGVDLENPDPTQTAADIDLDITLKDQHGDVITVIKDRIFSIPPQSFYHYGVTRQIYGMRIASLSATAKAGSSYTAVATSPCPVLSSCSVLSEKNETRLEGVLSPDPATAFPAMIHYQLRSREGKILGGGSIQSPDGLSEQTELPFSASIPIAINGADQILLSSAFDANE